MPALSRQERVDWLRLSRTRNVGAATFADLLAQYGSAAAALSALPELARRGGRRGGFAIVSRSDAEAEIAAGERYGAAYIAVCEPEYPALLAGVEAPPPIICVKGALHLLRQQTVAIVGARNASAAGIRMARDIASELSSAGFLVVSGLARGIDTAAHEGALKGGTCAVLAGGINVIYPPQNEALHLHIGELGVLLTEMPPGTQPQARQFPRRNRLISGMSLGVIVIEAAFQSGSLITARNAAEQGREVFAVPGSPLDPRSRGGNELIRQGATLVQNAAQVIEALTPLLGRPLSEPDRETQRFTAQPVSDAAIDKARPEILEKLGPAPVEIDELVRQTGLPAATVAVVLMELALAGRLERQPGQRVALID